MKMSDNAQPLPLQLKRLLILFVIVNQSNIVIEIIVIDNGLVAANQFI